MKLAMVERLAAAAMTLRYLPTESRTVPLAVRSAWPEMQRQCRFTYGETRRSSVPRPTPQQIDALDRMIDLLWRLPPPARQLVWGRACHVRWAALATRLGRSRTSVNRDYQQALALLVAWDAEDHHGE